MSYKILNLQLDSESSEAVIYNMRIKETRFLIKDKVSNIKIILKKDDSTFHTFSNDAQTGHSPLSSATLSRHIADLIKHTHKTQSRTLNLTT